MEGKLSPSKACIEAWVQSFLLYINSYIFVVITVNGLNYCTEFFFEINDYVFSNVFLTFMLSFESRLILKYWVVTTLMLTID